MKKVIFNIPTLIYLIFTILTFNSMCTVGLNATTLTMFVLWIFSYIVALTNHIKNVRGRE